MTYLQWLPTVFLFLIVGLPFSALAADKSFIEGSLRQVSILERQRGMLSIAMRNNLWGLKPQTLMLSMLSTPVSRKTDGKSEKIQHLIYGGPRFDLSLKINQHVSAGIYAVIGFGTIAYERKKGAANLTVDEFFYGLEPGARLTAKLNRSFSLLAGIAALSGSAGTDVNIDAAPIYELALRYEW